MMQQRKIKKSIPQATGKVIGLYKGHHIGAFWVDVEGQS